MPLLVGACSGNIVSSTVKKMEPVDQRLKAYQSLSRLSIQLKKRFLLFDSFSSDVNGSAVILIDTSGSTSAPIKYLDGDYYEALQWIKAIALTLSKK